MKRILVITILLAGSIANSAYKEVSLRGADAEALNAIFEKVGANRAFITSPDGSASANRVTYGDQGGKIVCDARGLMNNIVTCKISVDSGYKPQSVRVDEGVAGELSIVIFKTDDVKKIAESIPSGEFASSVQSPAGQPLVRIKCDGEVCRLTFAN